MSSIPVSGLIGLFQRMQKEHWGYEWGVAKEGCVDCSGAFAWAYKQYGKSIYQGSNRIARSYAVELLPISAAKPGMAAFKARAPTENGYALPAEYKQGGKRYNGDLRDFHHIGLVDEDTRYILNAQSTKTGFVRSPISQGWDCVAYLKAVDYGTITKGDDGMQTMVVTADSGSTVNLRARPDKNAAVLVKVPIGETVQVLTISGGWATIQRGGVTGYMMEQYLKAQKVVSTPGSVEARLAALEARVTALEGGKG